MKATYKASPPDRADGASGDLLTDIKGRLVAVMAAGASLLGSVFLTDSSSNEIASSTTNPGASVRGLIVRIAGRALVDSGVHAYSQSADGLLSDGSDLPGGPARGIRVLAAGDVRYETVKWDGTTRQTYTETVTAGTVIPIAIYKIHSTATTVADTAIQLGL